MTKRLLTPFSAQTILKGLNRWRRKINYSDAPMSMDNPILVTGGKRYDSSIWCEKGGAMPAPWWVMVKITPVGDPDTVVAEWHGPCGYASQEAAKKAGLEQARAIVLDLEKEEYRVPRQQNS